MRFDSQVQAFLLKQQHVGETDVLVTWFTKELGKVRSVVVGARRPSSRLAFALQPAALVSVRLVGKNPEHGLLTLAGVYSVRILAQDLNEAQAYVLAWFLEIILRGTPDGEKNTFLFARAEAFFDMLPKASSSGEVLMLGLETLVALLDVFGLAIHEDSAAPRYFSVRAGGFFTERQNQTDARPVTGELWRAYKAAERGQRETTDVRAQMELFSLLESFLEYHLERAIRSYALLGDIIKKELSNIE